MRKLKLYSYMLMLANMVLLAHSFVPHTHNNGVTLYTIEQTVGRDVVNCGCNSCSTFVEIIKESLSQKSNSDSDCNCCRHGKSNCYISVGYYTDQQNALCDIDYFYHPSEILIPNDDTYTEYEYAQITAHIPNSVPLINSDTRAPPSFLLRTS